MKLPLLAIVTLALVSCASTRKDQEKRKELVKPDSVGVTYNPHINQSTFGMTWDLNN